MTKCLGTSKLRCMDHATTKTTAAKAKAPRGWQCNECGKRMTAKAAERAMYGGTDGCPKCGGTDIDIVNAAPKARPTYVHRGEYHGPWQQIETQPCVGWRIVADELPNRDGWDVRAIHDGGTRVPMGVNRHRDPAPEMRRLAIALCAPLRSEVNP